MLAGLGREAQGRADPQQQQRMHALQVLAVLTSAWLHVLTCLAWTQAIQCPKEIVWLNGAPGSVRLASPPLPSMSGACLMHTKS